MDTTNLETLVIDTALLGSYKSWIIENSALANFLSLASEVEKEFVQEIISCALGDFTKDRTKEIVNTFTGNQLDDGHLDFIISTLYTLLPESIRTMTYPVIADLCTTDDYPEVTYSVIDASSVMITLTRCPE